MRPRRAFGALAVLGLLLLASVGLWHLATSRAAAAAQDAMAAEWQDNVPPSPPPTAPASEPATAAPAPAPATAAAAPAAEPATAAVDAALFPPHDAAAIALLEFHRPGLGPVFVGEGVSQEQIDRGPGHFPDSALPGQPGNFAVAGHRTTHGAPFANLDALRPGDDITVTDRTGHRFLYRVVAQRIVAPTDTWVVSPDPLGTGTPTLTLTTCHPRHSARQRLVIWAELTTS